MIDDKLHWYKDAIIYELHIKAFADSNGDGIGDFAGLLQKLDYLQWLGVTAIWVLPFYPSPLRDDGYDIADYYNINPNYGTLDDFKRFLAEAHNRGLRVITELVINHSSDQHPWFQRARLCLKILPNVTFTSGRTIRRNGGTCVSYFRIMKRATGRTIPLRNSIIGTASFITSRI